MQDAISGIVLAGGSSTRMGQDKRRLRLWGAQGPTLLAHTLNLLHPLCAERIVVLNDPEAWPDLGVRCVPDVVAGAGPLAGLVAGLQAMRHEIAVVLACDMPSVQPALLHGLLAALGSADAALPCRPHATRNALGLEPLLAVYRRSALPPLQLALARGEQRLYVALQALTIAQLAPEQWQHYDPQGLSFRNLNTPSEAAAFAPDQSV